MVANSMGTNPMGSSSNSMGRNSNSMGTNSAPAPPNRQIYGAPVSANVSSKSYSRKSSGSSPKNPRDDARRKQHNEVERRRRDKINNWISELSKIVPDCRNDTKTNQSKGGILAKTHEYIVKLTQDNRELIKKIKNTQMIPQDASLDERVEIQMRNMKNEANRLRKELEEAHADRDDIIEQLRRQGIKIKTKNEEHVENRTTNYNYNQTTQFGSGYENKSDMETIEICGEYEEPNQNFSSGMTMAQEILLQSGEEDDNNQQKYHSSYNSENLEFNDFDGY